MYSSDYYFTSFYCQIAFCCVDTHFGVYVECFSFRLSEIALLLWIYVYMFVYTFFHVASGGIAGHILISHVIVSNF